jgi:hypothetical protein
MSNHLVRQSAGSLEIILGPRDRGFYLDIYFERGAYGSTTDITLRRDELVVLHAKIGDLLGEKA